MNWFKRNKKWVITIVIALIAVFVIFGVLGSGSGSSGLGPITTTK